jgi:hypothetical protein
MLSFALLSSLLAAWPSTPPADGPQVVVVIGAPGTPEFDSQFDTWAGRWRQATQDVSGEFQLIGRAAAGPSTDKQLLRELLAMAASQPDGSLWLILVGHGTYDGRQALFNLRGPDVSPPELAQWLAPLKQQVVIVNCTACSAPFLNALSGQGRIIVTATRSGHERSFARFGDFFSSAVSDPTADLDKDGQASLLEAFLAASRRVEESYRAEARLATEHALLDDNGDGQGTPAAWFRGLRAVASAAGGAAVDGQQARQFHFLGSPGHEHLSPQQLARRAELERAVEELRTQKQTLNESAYYDKLELLFRELAELE